MISRNQIRQAAVQFLYGAGMDPKAPVDEARLDAFWDILLEPSKAAFNKARAKAVEHLTRDYADKARSFHTKAKDTLFRWQGDVRADALRDSLNDIVTREEAFEQALAGVRFARKNDPDCESDASEKAYAAVKILNDTVMQLRSRFISQLEDQPEYARQSVPLAKAIERLQEIGSRLQTLEHPEDTDNKAEFRNVIEINEDMQTLREEGGLLIQNVLDSADELDALINGIVENFSHERISPIERAIIRIAAYELKYKPELPTAVIASEAIRLAERYSITEAPKFINGILASIARSCREGEPPAAEPQPTEN